MAFVRERQIYTSTRKGEEMKEVEICVITEGRKQYYGSHRKRTRKALTAPKQAALNDKRAQIYFDRLANTNFGVGDYHATLTYADGHLPESIEDGEKHMNRYIARLRKLYDSIGIPFRYLYVTAYRTKKTGEPVRMHHHILLPGGVDRDLIENLWRAKSSKPGKLGEPLGYANVKSLQYDGNGISATCAYLMKQPREGLSRRWHSSIGLKKPTVTEPNDDKFDFRDLKEIVEDNADTPDVAFWEKHYPGWTLQASREYAYKVSMSDFTGASVRVKLRKLTPEELGERKRKRKCERRSGNGRAKEKPPLDGK